MRNEFVGLIPFTRQRYSTFFTKYSLSIKITPLKKEISYIHKNKESQVEELGDPRPAGAKELEEYRKAGKQES